MRNPLHLGAHEGDDSYPLPGDPPEPGDGATGGPLDDLRSGVKLWFDLGATVGKSLDRFSDRMSRYLARLERNTPVDYSNQAAAVYPAAGFLVLNLGTPDQGCLWEVRNCVVGGADQATAAAGTAGLYVSGYVPMSPTSASPGLAQMVDQAKTLPNVGFYGSRQLMVNDQETLYLLIFGGTPGQQYVANMSASVFNVGAAGGRVETTN